MFGNIPLETEEMNTLLWLILLAAAAAGVAAWLRSRPAGIAAVIVLLCTVWWMQYERQKAQDAAILALAQEVSPAQYLTLAAIANKSPEGRAAVGRALADGHVIWREYSPIEQQAASVIAYGAREDALRAVGLDPRKAADRDRRAMADGAKGVRP